MTVRSRSNLHNDTRVSAMISKLALADASTVTTTSLLVATTSLLVVRKVELLLTVPARKSRLLRSRMMRESRSREIDPRSSCCEPLSLSTPLLPYPSDCAPPVRYAIGGIILLLLVAAIVAAGELLHFDLSIAYPSLIHTSYSRLFGQAQQGR